MSWEERDTASSAQWCQRLPGGRRCLLSGLPWVTSPCCCYVRELPLPLGSSLVQQEARSGTEALLGWGLLSGCQPSSCWGCTSAQ